jgi:capsular exopolysaccharide synthesis family protein
MEIFDHLKSVLRRWPLLVVGTVVGGLIGFLTASTPRHRAIVQVAAPTAYTATTYISEGNLTGAVGSGTQAQLQAIAFLAGIGDVPKRVAAALHFNGNPQVLASRVTIKPDPTLPVISLTTTGTNGTETARLVNTYASQIISYMDGKLTGGYQAQIAALQAQDTNLQNQITALQPRVNGSGAAGQIATEQQRALLAQYSSDYSQLQQLLQNGPPTSGLITLEPAVPIPVQPAKSSSAVHVPAGRKARTAIGALLGLLVGAAAGFVLGRLDSRLRSKEEVEALTHFPVVAEIPTLPRDIPSDRPVVVTSQPTSPQAESFRSLRTAISLLAVQSLRRASGQLREGGAHYVRREDAQRQVVVVTSPSAGDGKSTTVANLAASFAQSGRSVLVLSCDFRAPKVSSYLGASDGPGVADLLDGPFDHDLANLAQKSDIEGVRVVPAGDLARGHVDLFTGAIQILDAARLLADVVLIDTAPVLLSNEATELIPWIDLMLLVVRSGQTTTGALAQAGELLNRLHAPVLGVVLNEAPPHPSRSQGYYDYYQGVSSISFPVDVPLDTGASARNRLVSRFRRAAE